MGRNLHIWSGLHIYKHQHCTLTYFQLCEKTMCFLVNGKVWDFGWSCRPGPMFRHLPWTAQFRSRLAEMATAAHRRRSWHVIEFAYLQSTFCNKFNKSFNVSSHTSHDCYSINVQSVKYITAVFISKVDSNFLVLNATPCIVLKFWK